MSEGAADGPTRRSAWHFLGWLIGTQRKGIILLVLAGLSWQGAAIFTPVVAAHAVDAIVAGERTTLYWWTGAVVLIALVEAIAGGFRHVFAMRNRAHGFDVMRGALLRQALHMDARYHERGRAGSRLVTTCYKGVSRRGRSSTRWSKKSEGGRALNAISSSTSPVVGPRRIARASCTRTRTLS